MSTKISLIFWVNFICPPIRIFLVPSLLANKTTRGHFQNDSQALTASSVNCLSQLQIFLYWRSSFSNGLPNIFCLGSYNCKSEFQVTIKRSCTNLQLREGFENTEICIFRIYVLLKSKNNYVEHFLKDPSENFTIFLQKIIYI